MLIDILYLLFIVGDSCKIFIFCRISNLSVIHNVSVYIYRFPYNANWIENWGRNVIQKLKIHENFLFLFWLDAKKKKDSSRWLNFQKRRTLSNIEQQILRGKHSDSFCLKMNYCICHVILFHSVLRKYKNTV